MLLIVMSKDVQLFVSLLASYFFIIKNDLGTDFFLFTVTDIINFTCASYLYSCSYRFGYHELFVPSHLFLLMFILIWLS